MFGFQMRTVLFIDPPAFCTTLAALDDPRLRSRPVVVSPPGADRAVILAVSAEARAAGLSRGMAVALARRICPDVIVLPPSPRRYAEAHQALYQIFARVAPIIEPRGWGHAYLDISGTERLFGPAVEVARQLEREALHRLGLPLAVGVATSKLVSETAATVVKREVGAEVQSVLEGREAAFLAPELVALLPEVPDRVRERLDDYHLERIGEIAAVGEQSLRVVFGFEGRRLHAHARGIDLRPVISPEVRAECRVAHTLATDTNDRLLLYPLLRALTERLGRRLRTRALAAGRLILTIRHVDDTTVQRVVRLSPCALDADLWRTACRALDQALSRRVAVRSIAITATDLNDGGGQLELWPDPIAEARPQEAALQKALDRVRRVMTEKREEPATQCKSVPQSVGAAAGAGGSAARGARAPCARGG